VTAAFDIDRSQTVGADAEGFGVDDLGATDVMSEGLSLSELLGEVFLPAATRGADEAPGAPSGEAA
jgi:hypothetical protein